MLLLCCLLQSCSAAADMLSADMLSALQSCSAAADMLSAAELFGCCCYAVYCRAVRLLLICYLLQSCSAADDECCLRQSWSAAAAIACCLLQSCSAAADMLSTARAVRLLLLNAVCCRAVLPLLVCYLAQPILNIGVVAIILFG